MDNVMNQKDPKPGKFVHALLNVSVLYFVSLEGMHVQENSQ